jgi:hypothetical protein
MSLPKLFQIPRLNFSVSFMSLLLEIRILLKTIQVVLFGKGSR